MMKKVDIKELEKANGGVIVEFDDAYWAFSDDGKHYSHAYSWYKDEIEWLCGKLGWTKEVMNREEFKKRFGRDIPYAQMQLK